MAPRLTWLTAPATIALVACTTSNADDRDLPTSGGTPGTGASTGQGSGGGGGSADDEPVPTCSTDLGAQLDLLRVPGLAAAILEDGALRCIAVAGSADLEQGRPVTPDTLFAWASVSKTITATAAMILFDEGKLGLDDDVGGYLPFAVRNPACPSEPITVRHLLTHSSSIVDNDAIYDPLYTIGDSPIALGDFVKGYVVPDGEYYDADGNFANACPGQVNAYSNIAVALLGHVIEHVAGLSFEQFCQERIFAPLGMHESSFQLAGLDLDHVAMPYDRFGQRFVAHGHFGYPTGPDGLLRTSVPQMARFLAMFAQHGAYGDHRMLESDTAQEMRRVQFPELDDTQALIWFYDDYGARTGLLGHDGSDPGTSSLMFFDPADGDGVLLVANGDWYDYDDDSLEADALFGALFSEAAD